jgi:hypothetical protein
VRWLALATLVLLVGGVGFAMQERKSALEGRLGSAATELGRRHVHVHCQSFSSSLIDVSNEAGHVEFDASGVPKDFMVLKRPICHALQRFPREWRTPAFGCVYTLGDCAPGIFEDVLAMHTLAHETWHLHGNVQEARTECNALQTTAQAATLFGADPRTAQAIAFYVWKKIYPYEPDDYRLADCANGGPYDLRPADPVWP